MMKILITPQAFKGTYTAFEVAELMRHSILKAYPKAEIVMLPISDGGDGFLDVMLNIRQGTRYQSQVKGPLGSQVTATWAVLKETSTAVIELSKVCGLAMVPADQRDPRMTTTFGVGEVIKEALEKGIRDFLIGLGGSATNDAGCGIIQALGGRFLDVHGNPLPLGGAALKQLHTIDLSLLDPRVKESSFLVGCDVVNPITGPEGASLVYSPQKGASPEVVQQLEEALKTFESVVEQDLNAVHGSGSAGGTAGGLHALLGAKLISGTDLVLDEMDFDHHLEGAGLVLVGEGCMDEQTVYGKGPIVVAKRAQAKGVPVIAYVGSVGKGYEAVYQYGITKVIYIC